MQWPNCGTKIKDYINGFTELLARELRQDLIGIYLHGSLATGSYFPPKSDIDILAVVRRNLPAGFLCDLGTMVAEYASTCPTVGNLECSIITLSTARHIPDPMPYEFHYSVVWHDRLLNKEVDYQGPRFDTDLFAHVLCVKKRGQCLYGQRIDRVFGEVPWSRFMFAILDDLDWVLAGENILEAPYYCILNICRVTQLLVERREYTYSKLEGGLWGLGYFPASLTPLIQKALRIYRSDRPVCQAQRKTGGEEWDGAALLAFRDYARLEIENLKIKSKDFVEGASRNRNA